MKQTIFFLFLCYSMLAINAAAQEVADEKHQFTLFDIEFTYSKTDADNSSPSQSHFYVKNGLINKNRPNDWTSPVNFRDGLVYIRIDVIEKPDGNEPTKWTLCYIPNKGIGNGYGCTSTDLYTDERVYQKEVSMHDFWENESIIWTKGIKQMDLVIKDNSGGQGHAHKRPDHQKFFPTRVRITMIQVAEGYKFNPALFPESPKVIN